MNAARTARVGWVRPANWSEHHNREAAGAHTHRVRRRIAWLSCSPTQAVLIASFRVSPAARSRRRCAQRRGARALRGLQHPHRGFATLPLGVCQAARRTGQGLITRVLSPSERANAYYRLSNAPFRSLGLPSLIDEGERNRSNRRVRTRMHGGVAGVGG